jgi:hypothetical protein
MAVFCENFGRFYLCLSGEPSVSTAGGVIKNNTSGSSITNLSASFILGILCKIGPNRTLMAVFCENFGRFFFF